MPFFMAPSGGWRLGAGQRQVVPRRVYKNIYIRIIRRRQQRIAAISGTTLPWILSAVPTLTPRSPYRSLPVNCLDGRYLERIRVNLHHALQPGKRDVPLPGRSSIARRAIRCKVARWRRASISLDPPGGKILS